MKAIIFNSGLGSRMGDFTKAFHKSMTPLKDGETILHRQLRILTQEGLRDFIITVGHLEEQIRAAAAQFPEARFTFVRNDIYDRTNYAYSPRRSCVQSQACARYARLWRQELCAGEFF